MDMLQFVFADQCNVHRDNGMAYFDLIPNLGKARYSFLKCCFIFLIFAFLLLNLAFVQCTLQLPTYKDRIEIHIFMIATINVYFMLYNLT